MHDVFINFPSAGSVRGHLESNSSLLTRTGVSVLLDVSNTFKMPAKTILPFEKKLYLSLVTLFNMSARP